MAWLGEHVELPADLTAEQLAADLVRVGLEEEQIHPAAVTGPLVVGRVLAFTDEPQKNGKVIRWVQLDVGQEHNDDDGARWVVCGAHNFAVGDLVVVALPGTVLPGGFEISARKTYGHVSDGMICSVRELGIGDDHEGILVLSTVGLDAAPGDDAKMLLGLADDVLEINVTPDRGYCFSMRGVAREYSHSTGARFTDHGLPGTISQDAVQPGDAAGPQPAQVDPGAEGFAVELDDGTPVDGADGCDRFVAQVVRGVRAGADSPSWMRQRLTQAGMRPISLAVDVTNYVMLDLGQPLHAYDLAEVAAPVVVRRAAPGERLTTLDDVERTLHPEDLLITDSPGGDRASRVLGLAGVMGGADSEVGASTTDVLLEGAHFDPVTVARSARRHKIVSEAAKRFERGVDPQLQHVAVRRAAELLVRYGGGHIEDSVTDVGNPAPPAVVVLDLGLPARLVGVDYTQAQVVETLETIGAEVSVPEGLGAGSISGTEGPAGAESSASPGGTARVEVTVPSWRPDLVADVDLVEEVARLRGYESIPSTVPSAPPGLGLTFAQRARRRIATALVEDGFTEVLTYPFVDPRVHDAMGLDAGDARRRAMSLVNPLVDAQHELRTNLLATLLDAARRNVARGHTDLAVFETGLVTRPEAGSPPAPWLPGGARPSDEQLAALEAAVPHQPRRLAGVVTGQREPAGWWGAGRSADHTDAVAAARRVAAVVGVELVVENDSDHAPWHPGRCARLTLADGTLVGHAGELHPRVVAAFDLPERAAAFEVDLGAVIGAAPGAVPAAAVQAAPVSAFPAAKFDLALVVDAAVPAGQVEAVVRAGASSSPAGDVVEQVRLFDVYAGDQIGETEKNLAFAFELRAPDRTLTADEVASVRDAAVTAASEAVGARLRA